MKAKRLLVVFATLIILSGCQCGADKTVPIDLVGVWKTSALTYADRFFQFKEDTIIFGTGGGNFNTYAITNIEKVSEEEKILYTVSYSNREGQEYKFSFYYYPENSGMIRFKNHQQIVWTKKES